MTKYIFITGDVASGLSKGITAASVGKLLKSSGLKVAMQKLDPYINVDPGTVSPYQHGEIFITEDGAQTSLDIGHYERFIDQNLNRFSNLTVGNVYYNVINKERRGEYLGAAVKVIPHITDQIKELVYRVGKQTDADVVITEIGGTIGDIEVLSFLKAVKQIAMEVGRENSLFVHVALVPFSYGSDEYNLKPAEHSVQQLKSMGISPNIIILRCDKPLNDSVFKNISMICNIKSDCVIESITLPVIYEVPLMLEKSNLSEIICRELSIKADKPYLKEWEQLIYSIKNTKHTVSIGLVGKYVQLHDAYLSVLEALCHAGYSLDTKVNIERIDAEIITNHNCKDKLKGLDGIIIPGGFGSKGAEGMILSANYARVNNIPFLGICIGMHIAIVEFARNVAGIIDANSGEIDELCEHKVVDFMSGQGSEIDKCSTLRLGSHTCKIVPNTVLSRCYGVDDINERHYNRFELNDQYRSQLTAAGLTVSGTSPNGYLARAIELSEHEFFVGVQYHPEFKSRPNKPHPLFKGFISAAIRKQKNS